MDEESMFRDFEPLKVYFIQNRIALILGLSSLFFVDVLKFFILRAIKRTINALTMG